MNIEIFGYIIFLYVVTSHFSKKQKTNPGANCNDASLLARKLRGDYKYIIIIIIFKIRNMYLNVPVIQEPINHGANPCHTSHYMWTPHLA